MNLSVDVVGVVVTMSSSSVNADTGHDMVGGGGNSVAEGGGTEDCEDGFAGDFGEDIIIIFLQVACVKFCFQYL